MATKDRKQALMHLRDKVEAGESRVQVEEAAFAVWPDGVDHFKATHASAAHCGSLDAAKALHEAVLPGWVAGVSENLHGHGWYGWAQTHEEHVEARNDNPARAWLIAILEALIVKESN